VPRPAIARVEGSGTGVVVGTPGTNVSGPVPKEKVAEVIVVLEVTPVTATVKERVPETYGLKLATPWFTLGNSIGPGPGVGATIWLGWPPPRTVAVIVFPDLVMLPASVHRVGVPAAGVTSPVVLMLMSDPVWPEPVGVPDSAVLVVKLISLIA